MTEGNKHISTKTMHKLFVEALGSAVTWHSSFDKKPLEVDIVRPYPLRLRVYMYNCTNPKGGRPKDEYKSQLIVPNQKRGSRGNFDNSSGRIVLLMAYTQVYNEPEEGVFILYDALMHTDFSYSANLQIKACIINQALSEPLGLGSKATGEIIIAAQRNNLANAIDRRQTL
jgi:hypothetical protein